MSNGTNKGDAGNAQEFDRLIKALGDGELTVRIGAARALGELGPKQAYSAGVVAT